METSSPTIQTQAFMKLRSSKTFFFLYCIFKNYFLSCAFENRTKSQLIIESLELERAFKDHLVQLVYNEWGHAQLDQVG